jgi:hypothetical protein
MKRLKLMPDYQCFPIWNISPGEYGDVNPAELPISKVLQLDLSRWAAAYDGTLNLEYPPASGFVSEEAGRAFEEEGTRLLTLLRDELGPGFVVEAQI